MIAPHIRFFDVGSHSLVQLHNFPLPEQKGVRVSVELLLAFSGAGDRARCLGMESRALPIGDPETCQGCDSRPLVFPTRGVRRL